MSGLEALRLVASTYNNELNEQIQAARRPPQASSQYLPPPLGVFECLTSKLGKTEKNGNGKRKKTECACAGPKLLIGNSQQAGGAEGGVVCLRLAS